MPKLSKNSVVATNDDNSSNDNKSSTTNTTSRKTITSNTKQKSEPTTKTSPTSSATKTKKIPSNPKRALSAYMFFVRENREKVKTENPGAKFGEIAKLVGEKWKALSDDDKTFYNEMAADDKKRYENEKTIANNDTSKQSFSKTQGKKSNSRSKALEEDEDLEE